VTIHDLDYETPMTIDRAREIHDGAGQETCHESALRALGVALDVLDRYNAAPSIAAPAPNADGLLPSDDFRGQFERAPDEPIDLDAYWKAPGNPPEIGAPWSDEPGYTWADKPTRLLYDCLREIYHLRTHTPAADGGLHPATSLIPDGTPVRLDECPPGPFLGPTGGIGLKTEYGNISGKDTGCGRVTWTMTSDPDVYVLESGEAWWGGTSSKDEKHAQMVTPLRVADLAPAPVEQAPTVEPVRAAIEGYVVGLPVTKMAPTPEPEAPAEDCVEVAAWVKVEHHDDEDPPVDTIVVSGFWSSKNGQHGNPHARTGAAVLRIAVRVPRRFLTHPEPETLPVVVAEEVTE